MTSRPIVQHQTDSDLIAYIHQQLPAAQREYIDQHLESCLECRRRLMHHAGLQHRFSQELGRQLALVHPATGWTDIAPRVRHPRPGRSKPRARATGLPRRVVYGGMAAVYFVVLFIGGLVLYTLLRDMVEEQQTVSLVVPGPTPTPSPTAALPEATITAPPIATNLPTLTPEPLPEITGPPVWDGEGRVNLLVMGIDQRGGQEGYWRTDTLMIITIDPQAQTLGMISVPRDLWVPIWAYDIENRINTAHYYGDYYDYPGGGPALARDTVAYNLGIPIHHYARINFTAFETLIDEIGGVDVYVDKTINDRSYPDEAYGYDPFYLPAGQHHLDGKTALKYARSRHGTGDFDRAERQQQVLLAARDQVVRLEQLPRLLANAPQIMTALGESVRTDLTLDQAIQLAQIVNEIPRDAYSGAVIDQYYTQPYTTSDGAQVLIPLRSRIAELYRSFFEEP